MENFAPTEFLFPDRPARSESLYRLSYRGPHICSMGKPMMISQYAPIHGLHIERFLGPSSGVAGTVS